jgi:cytochrome c5
MSKPNSFKIAFVLLALAVAASKLSRVAASPQDLPEGQGVEIARNRCLNCHEADVIMAQKLSRAGWVREVDKMVRWGAVVKDGEKDALVDYFAAHFTSSKPVAATGKEARGKEVYEAKCLLCHESDLIVAQRLSRAGWGREVDKMVRWGAVVKDDEKEPLADYLFKNYGPRPLAVTR